MIFFILQIMPYKDLSKSSIIAMNFIGQLLGIHVFDKIFNLNPINPCICCFVPLVILCVCPGSQFSLYLKR